MLEYKRDNIIVIEVRNHFRLARLLVGLLIVGRSILILWKRLLIDIVLDNDDTLLSALGVLLGLSDTSIATLTSAAKLDPQE